MSSKTRIPASTWKGPLQASRTSVPSSRCVCARDRTRVSPARSVAKGKGAAPLCFLPSANLPTQDWVKPHHDAAAEGIWCIWYWHSNGTSILDMQIALIDSSGFGTSLSPSRFLSISLSVYVAHCTRTRSPTHSFYSGGRGSGWALPHIAAGGRARGERRQCCLGWDREMGEGGAEGVSG